MRTDFEETKRKEVRLRDKLKELLDSGSATNKLAALKEAQEKAERFERELRVAQAQNIALRKGLEEQRLRDGATHASPHRDSHRPLSKSREYEDRQKVAEDKLSPWGYVCVNQKSFSFITT